MVISDPIAEYIDSQQAVLTDFIFRLTGDRSRAGVMAKDVCDFLKDDLSSRWTEDEIRQRLFTRAYELNGDALRGIEKPFLESYYRHQFPDIEDLARYYPWEIFLAELALHEALAFLLRERYLFDLPAAASILGRTAEEVAILCQTASEKMALDKRLLLEDLRRLPYYGFLVVPDGHHSSLSHIAEAMDAQKNPKKRWLVLPLIILGLLLGWILSLVL